MKSSKVDVKSRNVMTRLGQLSTVTLMALSLSAGNSFGITADIVKMYKAGTEKELVSLMKGSESEITARVEKAIALSKESNGVSFFKTWKDEPKAMGQAWAEVVLDKLKDKSDTDKLSDEDKKALHDFFFSEDVKKEFAKTTEEKERFEAFSRLFDSIAGFKKSEIANGSFLEAFNTQSIQQTLKVAFHPLKKDEKKEEEKKKNKKKKKTGERSKETDGSSVDCDKLVDDLRKDVLNSITAATDPLKNAMNEVFNRVSKLGNQQAPEQVAQNRRADQGDAALAGILGRLAQGNQNQDDRGEGFRPPQQQQLAQNDQQEAPSALDQPVPSPTIPQPPQEEVESAPSQLVQANANPGLKPIPVVSTTAEAIADAARKTKRVKSDADDVMGSVNNQAMLYGNVAAMNPQLNAQIVTTNVQALASSIADVEEQQNKVEAQTKDWSTRLKNIETELTAMTGSPTGALASNQTTQQIDAVISELQTKIAQTQNKAEKSKLEGELAAQKQIKSTQEGYNKNATDGIAATVKARQEELAETKNKLNELTGEADSLGKKKKALSDAITKEQAKLVSGMPMQPQGAGRQGMIQSASGQRRTNFPSNQNMSGALGGSSVGRLPLTR